MTLRQTIFLTLLTGVYLCFELAFNARILDVVGDAVSIDQLHHIEQFGRTLSGIAVALVVLQILLARRSCSVTDSPSSIGIVFWCLAFGAVSYFSLLTLVESLVSHSSPGFRRASLNIVLDEAATRRKQTIPTPTFKTTILSQAFKGEGCILRRIDHE